jgi:hypothetical protein
MSSVGSGGAAGAGGASRFSLLIDFTSRKMAKATMRKVMIVLTNWP